MEVPGGRDETVSCREPPNGWPPCAPRVLHFVETEVGVDDVHSRGELLTYVWTLPRGRAQDID